MATNYRFETTACSVEVASALFGRVLGLERLRASSPTPLVGESWWAAVTLNDAEEFADDGRRLGVSGAYTPVLVDPRLLAKDDLDDQGVFAPLLAGYPVGSIEQF